MDKVRLAIVGCGNVSQMNVPGYLEHPNCEVYALCDMVEALAERRAKQWGISPRIYTEFEQVLNDPKVDAVELLVPEDLHAQLSIAALEMGKHVSSQKPMGLSMAEADQIIAAAGKAKTWYRVTENFIYYPPAVKAKELLDSGIIGEPSLVRLHTVRGGGISDLVVERNEKRSLKLGMVLSDGVHKFALAMKWIGDIGNVQAMITSKEDDLGEAPSAMTWRFRNRDCLGMFDITSAPHMTIRGKYAPLDDFFEIHGSRGVIYVTRCTAEMLNLPPLMVAKGTEVETFDVPSDWLDSFKGAARDFIDGIIEDRQPDLDAPTAKKTIQVAFAMYEASRTGSTVDPDSITEP